MLDDATKQVAVRLVDLFGGLDCQAESDAARLANVWASITEGLVNGNLKLREVVEKLEDLSSGSKVDYTQTRWLEFGDANNKVLASTEESGLFPPLKPYEETGLTGNYGFGVRE
jgi:hypothetical protein